MNNTIGNWTIETFNWTAEYVKSGAMFTGTECYNWCKETHIAFNFGAAKLVGVALAVIYLHQAANHYGDRILKAEPKLKWFIGFFQRQGLGVATWLIIAFLIWNLYLNGYLYIPFFDITYINR